MSIRVSSNQMVYGYQKQLNDANTRQTSLLEQGDGSKLHRPSDNPVDYSKFLRYDTSINENEQYTNNVNTALSWMKTADAALINVTNIQTTFKEKSILAANSTNNGTDMQAIGKEMMAEIQEIVSLGNTMQGDRYVFGGQKDLVRPFELSTEEVDRGLAKTLDETQAAYFKTADSSGTMTQMLVLEDEANPNNLYYLDTTTGNLYTKDFVENGYKDKKIAGQMTAVGEDVVAQFENEKYSHIKLKAGEEGTSPTPVEDAAALVPPVKLAGSDDDIYLLMGTDGDFDETGAPYSKGTYFYLDTTGKIYTTDGKFTEVGTFPSEDYKYAPKLVNGCLALTDDDGNYYLANISQKDRPGENGINTGAIVPAEMNAAGNIVPTNGFPTTLDADNTIDDLFFTNQRYTWSDSQKEVSGDKYIGVKDVNGNQFYYDQDTRDIYTEDYLDEVISKGAVVDSKKSVGNLKSFYVAANFDNRGKIIEDDANGNTVANVGADYETNIIDKDGRTVTLKLATVKQQLVTYTGDEKQISMVKKNGTTEPTADTVNVTGSEIFGMDLFDDPNSGNLPSGTAMINEMLTVHAKVVSDDQLWMDTDGVTIADSAHAQTIKTETKMGARTQLYNSVSTMLTTQNELITNDITNVSSTDVARLAVQLMQEQTIYNMSLSLGARILPQSLADYL